MILLLLWHGSGSPELHFNPVYRKIERFTEPPLSSVSRFLPPVLKPYSLFLFFALFFLVRALHYYSYRGEFLGLSWGPALLVFSHPTFIVALAKSIFATALFYFGLLTCLILLEGVSRTPMIQDPAWRILSVMAAWPKILFKKSFPWKGKFLFFTWIFLGTLLLFTAAFFVFLFPFGSHVFLVPGKEMTFLVFPKMLILNLFVATIFFTVLFYLLLFRALISWFFPWGVFGLGEFISHVTDPVLDWLSRWNLRAGPIDFSVLVAILLCLFAQQLLRRGLIWTYLHL